MRAYNSPTESNDGCLCDLGNLTESIGSTILAIGCRLNRSNGSMSVIKSKSSDESGSMLAVLVCSFLLASAH